MLRGQVGQRHPVPVRGPASSTPTIDTKVIGKPDSGEPTRFGDWYSRYQQLFGREWSSWACTIHVSKHISYATLHDWTAGSTRKTRSLETARTQQYINSQPAPMQLGATPPRARGGRKERPKQRHRHLIKPNAHRKEETFCAEAVRVIGRENWSFQHVPEGVEGPSWPGHHLGGIGKVGSDTQKNMARNKQMEQRLGEPYGNVVGGSKRSATGRHPEHAVRQYGKRQSRRRQRRHQELGATRQLVGQHGERSRRRSGRDRTARNMKA